jgi:hypothetical protein
MAKSGGHETPYPGLTSGGDQQSARDSSTLSPNRRNSGTRCDRLQGAHKDRHARISPWRDAREIAGTSSNALVQADHAAAQGSYRERRAPWEVGPRYAATFARTARSLRTLSLEVEGGVRSERCRRVELSAGEEALSLTGPTFFVPARANVAITSAIRLIWARSRHSGVGCH